MSRIAGVNFLGYAPITVGTDGQISYGAVKEIPQFISFSATKQFAETTWYSNDKKEEVFSAITGYEIEVVLGRLSGDMKADFSGSDYDEKGVLTEASDDEQKEFALVVVLNQLPTGTLNEVFYRCKLRVETTEGETKTDSITDSQVSLVGTAIPNAENIIKRSIDSNDENADAGVVGAWKTTVYVPTGA